MQRIILGLSVIVFSISVQAQQTFTTLVEKKNTAVAEETGIPKTIKLYGIGNLNTETLSKVNSSGKFALLLFTAFNVCSAVFNKRYKVH